MAGTMPEVRDTALKKTDRNSLHMELIFNWEKKKKYISKIYVGLMLTYAKKRKPTEARKKSERMLRVGCRMIF